MPGDIMINSTAVNKQVVNTAELHHQSIGRTVRYWDRALLMYTDVSMCVRVHNYEFVYVRIGTCEFVCMCTSVYECVHLSMYTRMENEGAIVVCMINVCTYL